MLNKIEMNNITKKFKNGDNDITILNIDNFTVDEHEIISIIGSSGSGKSTLLQVMAGLDNPTTGNIILSGSETINLFNKESVDINKLSSREKNKLRKKMFGFIYQKHFLIKDLSVLDNLLIAANDKEKAFELLNEVELFNKKDRFYNELSGGERQRVSICRALINSPKFVFADEPTGALDNKTANSVWELFLKIKSNHNFGLIMVTHDIDLAKKCDKIYHLKNSIIKEIKKDR